MTYHWQRCDTPLKKPNQNVEVALAEFSAIGNLTESEYCKRMFDKLESGDLMDLLTLNGQCDLGDWITEKYLDNQKEFLVVFRLSLNRIRDVVLFCVCSMNLKTDEAKIYVRHAVPGFIDAPPHITLGLEKYEIDFSNMEPKI